ncbi:EEF1A lysine methyltransferase 2, partial [Plecturocebus cupreus]
MWWHAPVVPATQEAVARELLEPGRWRLHDESEYLKKEQLAFRPKPMSIVPEETTEEGQKGSGDPPISASGLAGTTGVHHHAQLIFVFFVETVSCHVAQAGLKLLDTSNLPALASKILELLYLSWPLILTASELDLQNQQLEGRSREGDVGCFSTMVTSAPRGHFEMSGDTFIVTLGPVLLVSKSPMALKTPVAGRAWWLMPVILTLWEAE